MPSAPSQHDPLHTKAPCRSAHHARGQSYSRHPSGTSAGRKDTRPINRAQRLHLLVAALLLGHLVELVLAVCVAHANANAGAHASKCRASHRCACPQGAGASARACVRCALSGLRARRSDTRTVQGTDYGRGRADDYPVRVQDCASRGRWQRTEKKETAKGAQDGAVRQLADRVFYARIPHLRHLPSPGPPHLTELTTAHHACAVSGCGVPGSGVPDPVWRCGIRSETRPMKLVAHPELWPSGRGRVRRHAAPRRACWAVPKN